MALQRPTLPWLIVDDNYSREHQSRKKLFETKGDSILGCRAAAHAACKELLLLVVEELLERYPDRYELAQSHEAKTQVRITETSELLPIEGPEPGAWQLRTAALLAMEDFNVLIRDKEKGHRL